ncbi:MAG: PhnD/SsuA/transferrin family substrate-binding protein [Desulfuromonadaceae bacterium]|nr:PhnD/SsuA/transferrin family substrate-binding protein [Desulfuromonadaceae bacterium]
MLRWLLLVIAAVHITLAPGVSATPMGSAVSNSEAQTRGLVFGVHPFMSAAELQRRFSPLLEYLEVHIGSHIDLKIASSHAEAVEMCAEAQVDFAFVGPSLYAQATRQDPRILPLGVILGAYPRLRGVIVVREDSLLTKIPDLKGTRFAFVAPEATVGFQVPLYVLDQSGVHLQDLSGYSFLGNHANVGYAVLAGRFDAGAVKYEMFERLQSSGLRILAYTPEVVDQTFLATARVEPPLAQQVKNILQQMNTSPEGRKVLTQLRADITGIVPAEDAEFTALRFYADYAQRCLRDSREQSHQ